MFYLFNFWSSTVHSMKSAQHCLYNSGKGRCTRYIWSNDMSVLRNRVSAFLIFFMNIENAVYTSFESSTLLFINELMFDIINSQNNQSLEFEWIPMLAPPRSVNDWRFSWLSSVFLNSFQDWLNSVQQCQENFTKDTGKQKLSYRGKHMKDWK